MTELLLPVGTKEMCLAAIHNGADAVYMGVPGFNARGRTTDFSKDELKELIDLCHLYNVKVLLAFNVLIFEQELEFCINVLKDIIPLGPDAFIVQDLGLAKIIKEICPEQVVHASTQMTITNSQSIELLEDLNIKRFVLGREVSIEEIKKIKEKTDKELEVFVHGALCVAYSGQCLTSESLGGRSANRGQCAQSCRFEYDLIVDDKKYNTYNRDYLVSPKDLCGINEVKKLQEIGVACLKVEGRLKGPDYVASCAKSYRQELDQNTDEKQKAQSFNMMEKTFSRGFFSGWLNGVDHQQLVEGSYGNHRGPLVGKVHKVDSIKNVVWVESKEEIVRGMGILITEDKESAGKFDLGANVYDVIIQESPKENLKDNLYGLKFQNDISIRKVMPAMRVFINKDVKLQKELEKTYQDKSLLKRLPLTIKVTAKEDQKLRITASDEMHTVSVESEENLSAAQNRPITKEDLTKEFSKLGQTCFLLKSIEIHLPEGLFLANKQLKQCRQRMIEYLYTQRVAIKEKQIFPFNEISNENKQIIEKTPHKSKMNILIRSAHQLEDFLKTATYIENVGYIILDYEFGKDYDPGVKLVRSKGLKVAIATTRILKPGEYHHLKHIHRLNPDAVLARNLGAFHFLKNLNYEGEKLGDFSLNITNSITADYLMNKGFNSLCLSYDLNANQVEELLKKTNNPLLEINIHQYMPEFHMEHCVFAAFLSKGSSFKDCGKPCEKHKVELKDPYGNYHTLQADQECRNTLYKNIPQAMTSKMKEWQTVNIGSFRIEALNESGEELARKCDLYGQFLDNKIELEELTDKLNVIEKFGVTEGQLLFKDNYQDRKQFK
ncbi:DUF3656 domain-containing protein [Bacteriovoracaceae bacterium]|nr:DUF3656 domain-containing protein [Bacteriovoracaceae bacterium]